jgi:lysophospholipase L1-like esterase
MLFLKNPHILGPTTKTAVSLEVKDQAPPISYEVECPSSFFGMKENVIADANHTLNPIFGRLRKILNEQKRDTLRIVHIGDSHIRGRIYPRTMGNLLDNTFGSINYIDMGINGATCHSFVRSSRMRKLSALNPDMLIVSFGTNESYGRHYDSEIHYSQIDELVSTLRQKFPDAPILLTTPPGSYRAYRQYYYVRVKTGRRHKRTRLCRRSNVVYRINQYTPETVSTICKYASDHSLPYWNLYNVVGGEEFACQNWSSARLMRPDHVHYISDGYRLQGQLLYQAFIKAYNNYVSR